MHTFGKTLFIEQEAGIVAAHVDKCAERSDRNIVAELSRRPLNREWQDI